MFDLLKLRRVQDAVASLNLKDPEPSLDAVEDMTGRSMGMDHYIALLGTNFARPKIGDVMILLDLCGMGVVVNKDRRARVVSTPDKLAAARFRDSGGNGPSPVVGLDNGETVLLANLAPCGLAARTWVCVR